MSPKKKTKPETLKDLVERDPIVHQAMSDLLYDIAAKIFTKQHYIFIAAAMKEALHEATKYATATQQVKVVKVGSKMEMVYVTPNTKEAIYQVAYVLADVLADKLSKDNPRFNSVEFLQACGFKTVDTKQSYEQAIKQVSVSVNDSVCVSFPTGASVPIALCNWKNNSTNRFSKNHIFRLEPKDDRRVSSICGRTLPVDDLKYSPRHSTLATVCSKCRAWLIENIPQLAKEWGLDKFALCDPHL